GYAELVKEAFISDKEFLGELLQTDIQHVSNETLINHLQKGIQVKTDIVEADEREAGMRKYLNFGHTLAQALEAELGYGVMTHAEAVAARMLSALRWRERNYNQGTGIHKLIQWMKNNHDPTTLPKLSSDRLLNKMKSDTKVIHDNIPMILLSEIGQAVTIEFSYEELSKELEYFLGEVCQT